MNKIELIQKTKELNFQTGEYAVFGSALLCIWGIRDSKDIDIIVNKNLWERCLTSGEWTSGKALSGADKLEKENIEIFREWNPGKFDPNELIKSANIIEDVPFVDVKYLLEWKKLMGREKDISDIELIEGYLNK
ncbi:MAG: hypothetical protein WCO84_02910 [bacterium]